MLILAGQIWTNKSSTSLVVSPGVSVFHGPQSTQHDFAKLFTIAQSGQVAVERLPM